jgi:hypothetical protein
MENRYYDTYTACQKATTPVHFGAFLTNRAHISRIAKLRSTRNFQDIGKRLEFEVPVVNGTGTFAK